MMGRVEKLTLQWNNSTQGIAPEGQVLELSHFDFS